MNTKQNIIEHTASPLYLAQYMCDIYQLEINCEQYVQSMRLKISIIGYLEDQWTFSIAKNRIDAFRCLTTERFIGLEYIGTLGYNLARASE